MPSDRTAPRRVEGAGRGPNDAEGVRVPIGMGGSGEKKTPARCAAGTGPQGADAAEAPPAGDAGELRETSAPPRRESFREGGCGAFAEPLVRGRRLSPKDDDRTVSVRAAREDDLAALAEIDRLSSPQPWGEDALRPELSLPHALLLCAEAGGAPVGFVDIHLAGDSAYINELAVAPAARRRGVAAALVSAALDKAERRGFTRVVLDVREGNAAARALYQKLGFKSAGVRKRLYRDPDEDGLVMIREI